MSVQIDKSRKLQNKTALGVTLMIGGLALYALSDAFTKQLLGSYTPYQTSFVRAMARLVPLLITLLFHGNIRQVFATQHPKRHLIRLAVNLAYTFSFIQAFSKASLTSVYTLSYTSPLFMIILSALILKESISWDRWAAVLIGMVGVIIAMRPGPDFLEQAALLVLFGTFLGALNKILMRRLAETEHSLAIAIYPNITMMLVMAPFLMSRWVPMPKEDWILCAIVGVITAAGQYAITQALRFAQGSALAPVDYSTYFWVVAFDALWWHKFPNLWMVVGAAIIVSSNLYILVKTRREQTAKKAAA